MAKPEPFAARLHFIPRLVQYIQRPLVAFLRGYFERAPGWVLLTTKGRKTGLQREILLPCERFAEGLLVISTYGYRSNWIRNIQHDPNVGITCAGWLMHGHAEIIDDLEHKQALMGKHPFFVPAPIAPLHILFRTILRPLLVLCLRRWVTVRPVVVIRPAQPMR